MFYLFFNSPQDLRAPSADRRESLPRDQYLRPFYNASPKIWGPPLKNFGAKNVQNLARFYTTSDFWSWISPELDNISKIGKICDRERFRVQRNKSGELWWTIQKVVHVRLDLPKSTFSGDYISAPNQLTNQPTNQPIDRSVDRWIDQSVSQSVSVE